MALGGSGDDALAGEDGSDDLFGFNGEDRLVGGDQADLLKGGGEDDALFGDEGNDSLDGGENSDACDGGAGRNTEVRCEPADVSVRVVGPQRASDGAVIRYKVIVKNHGPAELLFGYKLDLQGDFRLQARSAGGQSRPAVRPTEFRRRRPIRRCQPKRWPFQGKRPSGQMHPGVPEPRGSVA